jgi:hypothetical protein
MPHRGRAWEMRRYRAYQAQLAGHTIGDTSGCAAAFLNLVVSHNQTAAWRLTPIPPGPGLALIA